MIKLNMVSDVYVELRAGNRVLEQRYTTVPMSEIATLTFKVICQKYRVMHIAIIDWDESAKSLELFGAIASSRIAIGDNDKITDIMPRLRNEAITLMSPLKEMRFGVSKYITNPHMHFETAGVRVGVHPSQPILEEEAVDLLLTSRDGYDNPNLIWAIGKYFFSSIKVGPNYFISDGNRYAASNGDSLQLSTLDVSELDCGVPVPLSMAGELTDDDELIVKYGEGGYSGALLVFCGKMILDLKDTKDYVQTSESFKLPMDKLNISIAHLAQFCSEFGISEPTYQGLINHTTSFIIPYKNDLYVEHDVIRNDIKDELYFLSAPLDYKGEMVLDAEGELVPIMMEQIGNQVIISESVLSCIQRNSWNVLSTTNFESKGGDWVDTLSALLNGKMGLQLSPRQSHYSMVSLKSFNGFEYEGGE